MLYVKVRYKTAHPLECFVDEHVLLTNKTPVTLGTKEDKVVMVLINDKVYRTHTKISNGKKTIRCCKRGISAKEFAPFKRFVINYH